MPVNLAQYDNRHYRPGAGAAMRVAWYCVNALLFNSWLWPESRLKCAVLRLFGARIGRGVVIKPRVNIKYPWNLQFGDYVWIGEGVWIDSLAEVRIESNVCISQEAFLLTGNHNYKDPAFGLIVQGIHIEEGAWIGARAIVCPGVRVRRNTVLTAGSMLSDDSVEDGIYRGNPAERVRERRIEIGRVANA
jgi:putative colanic acid biosynthesis acetyltransferase WcaF